MVVAAGRSYEVYPKGGGLTAERRVFREHIRMQAAELFALGHDNAAVSGCASACDRYNGGTRHGNRVKGQPWGRGGWRSDPS